MRQWPWSLPISTEPQPLVITAPQLWRSPTREAGRPVAILADLAGPKIRVGTLETPIELEAGTVVVVAPEAAARPGEIPTTYAPLASEIQDGDQVLVDDGLLELRCVGVVGDRTRLEVVRGGTLRSRKGMNLPTVDVKAPSLTEKDLGDLAFAFDHERDEPTISTAADGR